MNSDTGMPSRREFLRQGTALGAALALGSQAALAQALEPDPEVPNEQIAKLLKDLFGDRPIRRGHVALDMPVVAEDGRVVPVIIDTDLPMTAAKHVKAVHLIVDHNPDPHLAAFEVTPALGKLSIQTRIKMKRTTWVRCIAETSDGEVWADYARVSVTLNGCG
ncbi:MAG TPA: thiosulfate oxidation carrier protein SoxY [Gemmatimonadales bacterium]|nr:thiosulfate oxidation carrier protein SoxY [Gemmatimonadales bacterium]